MTQLEQLGADTSPAVAAYRDRIRDQFTQRYDDKTAAQAELDTLTAAAPPAEDPALIDELPYAPALLTDVPDDIRARIYAPFQVHALYRAEPPPGHHRSHHHRRHPRHHRGPDRRPAHRPRHRRPRTYKRLRT